MCVQAAVVSVSMVILGTNLTLTESIRGAFLGENVVEEGGHVFQTCGTWEWNLLIAMVNLGAPIASILFSYSPCSFTTNFLIANTLYSLGLLSLIFITYCPLAIVGRLVTGLAVGISSSLVPAYLFNLSQNESTTMKCVIGSFNNIGYNLGILLGQVMSYYYHDASNWKIGIYIILGGILLHSLLLMFVKNPDASVKVSNGEDAGIFKLFRDLFATILFWIVILCHIGQHMTGVTSVIQQSGEAFGNKEDPGSYTLMFGGINLSSVLVSIPIIAMVGRKRIFLFSMAVTAIGLLLLWFDVDFLITAAIYLFGFNVGYGPVPWLMISDIFPKEYERAGRSVAVAVNWITAFIFVWVYPWINGLLGKNIYWMYLGFTVFLFIFIATFYHDKNPVNVEGNAGEETVCAENRV
jgi:MFS family permease